MLKLPKSYFGAKIQIFWQSLAFSLAFVTTTKIAQIAQRLFWRENSNTFFDNFVRFICLICIFGAKIQTLFWSKIICALKDSNHSIFHFYGGKIQMKHFQLHFGSIFSWFSLIFNFLTTVLGTTLHRPASSANAGQDTQNSIFYKIRPSDNEKGGA